MRTESSATPSLPLRRFRRLWKRLGALDDGPTVFAHLSSAYAEEHRAYHDATHIVDCLATFDELRDLAPHPDEVEAALWFHDAVYDPRARDNEERSALLALDTLTRAGVGHGARDRVAALVRATAGHIAGDDPDAAVLLDADLAILGAPAEEFDHFERGVRREFAWVSEDVYRLAREAVLRSFQARPRLYATDRQVERREAHARANLSRSVARLQQSRHP